MTNTTANAGIDENKKVTAEPSMVESNDVAIAGSEPATGTNDEVTGRSVENEEHAGPYESAKSRPMMEMAIKALRKGGAEIGKGTKIALKETERLAAKARTLSLRLPGQSGASFRQRPPYVPAADFILGDGGYEITIDLPGLELKDISVKLSGDHFAIRGERRQPEIPRRNTSYLVHERRFGTFARSFHIPRDADASRSEATFDRGILKIWIPKYPDTIEVRSS